MQETQTILVFGAATTCRFGFSLERFRAFSARGSVRFSVGSAYALPVAHRCSGPLNPSDGRDLTVFSKRLLRILVSARGNRDPRVGKSDTHTSSIRPRPLEESLRRSSSPMAVVRTPLSDLVMVDVSEQVGKRNMIVLRSGSTSLPRLSLNMPLYSRIPPSLHQARLVHFQRVKGFLVAQALRMKPHLGPKICVMHILKESRTHSIAYPSGETSIPKTAPSV